MPDDVQVAFDAGRPSIARIYDYWLGGKDNFAADRAEAERVLCRVAYVDNDPVVLAHGNAPVRALAGVGRKP